MSLDEALYVIRAYGRCQIIWYLIISLFDNLPSIWHMSIMTFIGYEPEHYCRTKDQFPNVTWTDPSDVPRSKCVLVAYNESGYNTTLKCTSGWVYSTEQITSTIVTDWDLVCDRNLWPEMSQMVFNFGVMVGAILFGFLSDEYGRKKIFISTLLAQSVFGLAAAFSVNYFMFTVCRFFIGAFEQGINITGFVMATELFPPKERTIFSTCHEFIWAAGGALLPVFAYFLRDWRHLQIAVSVPNILGISLIWVIPESMVWLISKGRLKEAEAILKIAGERNKRPCPDGILERSDREPDRGPSTKQPADTPTVYHAHTFVDLFRTRVMRVNTFCYGTLWAFNTMVYYGLAYNTPNLGGNMYLNFFIGQMIELPSVALTLWAIYRIGRRWPLFIFHVIGGVCCIISPFTRSVPGLSITLAMVGKFAINSSFTILYVYGPEIYPTILRNTGTGMGSFAGRIGGILYPYINYLSKIDSPLSKHLPLVVFGILSIIGGLAALPLPETRNNPLPETINDVENYQEFCRSKDTKDFALKPKDGPEKEHERRNNDTQQ